MPDSSAPLARKRHIARMQALASEYDGRGGGRALLERRAWFYD